MMADDCNAWVTIGYSKAAVLSHGNLHARRSGGACPRRPMCEVEQWLPHAVAMHSLVVMRSLSSCARPWQLGNTAAVSSPKETIACSLEDTIAITRRTTTNACSPKDAAPTSLATHEPPLPSHHQALFTFP